jgi:hypothetical protein
MKDRHINKPAFLLLHPTRELSEAAISGCIRLVALGDEGKTDVFFLAFDNLLTLTSWVKKQIKPGTGIMLSSQHKHLSQPQLIFHGSYLLHG